ncbi:ABC transporter permease [Pelagovum pacificum]|uniref:ABC transporter permease n=1 Tax=Pelagovum pacificum TaxID=2588711 RepID=A0A5C5G9V0_9RHOB|nr:ABC transporter permease [Pelagovum pacificum]QQA42465.1 ABC transporter permease [Pelagovum pacificum]TNY31548.1 ABC transporter permease [Pelagovum pacificum]
MAAIEPTDPKVLDDEAASLWGDAWARLKANRIAMAGLVMIALLFAIALIGPYVTPYDFLDQNLDLRSAPPSWAHPFGTDELGRDVLSRVIFGTRTALIVGVVVTLIAAALGAFLGALAGYIGGRVDRFVMWLTDVFMSVPQLLLVIVVTTTMKPPLSRWMDAQYMETLNPFYRNTMWIDFFMVFGGISLVMWPQYARIVRGQVLSVRSRPYVTAARALGLGQSAILRRYILPNSIGPLIVAVSAGIGQAMVLESAFSFLGVGVQPPIPSWGLMISDGLRTWQQYPHLLAAPALTLGIATVAFSFLGDGLNDALNPKGSK